MTQYTRRQLLGASLTVGTIVVAGCNGTTDDPTQNNSENNTEIVRGERVAVDELSDEAQQSTDLAEQFHEVLSDFYDDQRTYLNEKGEIFVELTPNSESADAVERELKDICVEFGETITQPDNATTLTIITGKVQCIAPESSVKPFARGELEERAFRKTVGMLSLN